jgi:hypothetical protein
MTAVEDDLIEALRGDPEIPEISPLSWLRSMIRECQERGPAITNDDPDAFYEMVREVQQMEERCSAIIASIVNPAPGPV